LHGLSNAGSGIVLRTLSLWFALLTVPLAADPNFPLGVESAQRIAAGALTSVSNVAAATDSQGAVYLLVTGSISPQTVGETSYILKLTAAADRVVYWTMLPFPAYTMAVDAAGNVYVPGSNFVEKLSK
jgi:hypothetical protein